MWCTAGAHSPRGRVPIVVYGRGAQPPGRVPILVYGRCTQPPGHVPIVVYGRGAQPPDRVPILVYGRGAQPPGHVLYWSVTVRNQAAHKEVSGGQLSKASLFFFYNRSPSLSHHPQWVMGPSSCRKTSSGLLVILHNGALYNYFVIYHNPIPGNSAVKNLPSLQETTCNIGDTGSILGLRGSPGEGNGNPFQYSCLDNFMGRGAWRATVQGITKESYMT